MGIKISSRLIADEALARDWEVHYFDDTFSSLVKITPPGKVPKIFRSTVTISDSYVGGSVTNNKYETYLVLRDAGLPVPDTVLYDVAAIDNFLSHHETVVVKPASTDHGDGITINLHSADEIAQAVEYARRYTQKERDILVQHQLSGSDHRMLVVGEKVFVARRQKPTVTGDGVHTVRELVAMKNQDTRRGESHSSPLSFINSERVEAFLGGGINTVLPADVVIDVLGTSNLSAGGDSVELTAVAHETFKEIARRAARTLELRVCAVDIMCSDITQSVDTQIVGIIEMNVLPGIRMHHFPSEGQPVNVAGAILDEVFGGTA